MIGIYRITNIMNGMKYIGQSVNIVKRTCEHKRDLKNNIHPNSRLQNSYNKYGIVNFEFTVLEECEVNQLTEKELYWINFYDTMNRNIGYNIAVAGNAPMANRTHTEESKAKMSKFRKISTIGDGNGFYGKNHTNETKKRISAHLKGKFVGIKNPMYGMNGELNHFYGKNHTNETKKRMSVNHADFTGEKHPKAKLTEYQVMYIINLLNEAMPINEICSITNIGRAFVESIKYHKNWNHITNGIKFPFAKDSRKSSRYMGVHFDKRSGNWLSNIYLNGNKVRVGTFKTEEDAAIAYNEKAKQLLGDKAIFNILKQA